MPDIKGQEWETLRHKLEIFRDEAPKVSIRQLLEAMLELTDIEFRMWLNACETYGSFDPSHFKGQEHQFLTTGKWDWVPVEVEHGK